MLRYRDDGEAIVFWNEAGRQGSLSYSQLHDRVARLAAALRAADVKVGDRIAGFLPNLPETAVAMLAAASLGAIWSSTSPDFGVAGVLDRFIQIEPKILFTTDGYFYNGKTFDCLERAAELAERIPSIERVVVVPYVEARPACHAVRDAVLWEEFVASARAARSGARFPSPNSPSITRSTFSIRRARLECPSASFTGPEGRSCSISRNWCCTPTSSG